MKKTGEGREPAGVAKLRRRIESWRRTRARSGPMPEDLWSAAGSLARQHGVNPVAKALRLHYYALKDRLDGTRPRRCRRPAFVEIAPAATVPSCFVLELDGSAGRKMTVRLSSAVDVVALVEAFWRSGT